MLEINKKKALIKTAKHIHDAAYDGKLIPYDTGYLSEQSPVFRSQNDTAVIGYDVDYAQYVWLKNKTGVPEWTFKAFEQHKSEILHEFFSSLFKGF